MKQVKEKSWWLWKVPKMWEGKVYPIGTEVQSIELSKKYEKQNSKQLIQGIGVLCKEVEVKRE